MKLNSINEGFAFNENNSLDIITIEMLKDIQPEMSEDEKQGWYLVDLIKQKINAYNMLQMVLTELEKENNTIGFSKECMENISVEEINELQEVIDKICNKACFYICYEKDKIEIE